MKDEEEFEGRRGIEELEEIKKVAEGRGGIIEGRVEETGERREREKEDCVEVKWRLSFPVTPCKFMPASLVKGQRGQTLPTDPESLLRR